ncbi:DUF366 family protein [Methanococcoides orientis]|uniref:DUF366 family protein n=1 Tax=Methanococcoides orientis TaxID=2822137 RepID=UPI001E602DD6|nr:DUF366 family protein [Methanococcoides orientis]UGV39983.1 DUF366 family protein [Methanococcoides orientis]
MESIILDEKTDYDGSQISSLWAYNLKGIQHDSIVAFRGGCDVKLEHMIDLEDKRMGDSIYSTDMLHFLIEHFDSTDLKLVYARQRLFTAIVAEALLDSGIMTTRQGDDLFVNGKKLTISIASTSAVSQKIHFGINVFHYFYGNLTDNGLDEVKAVGLLEDIANRYVAEFEDIEKDLRKSRPLDVV